MGYQRHQSSSSWSRTGGGPGQATKALTSWSYGIPLGSSDAPCIFSVDGNVSVLQCLRLAVYNRYLARALQFRVTVVLRALIHISNVLGTILTYVHRTWLRAVLAVLNFVGPGLEHASSDACTFNNSTHLCPAATAPKYHRLLAAGGARANSPWS